MKIITYKPVIYDGCIIYVRRIGMRDFEYLTIIRGELYTFCNTVTPELYARLFYWLSITQDVFSDKEIKANIQYLQLMAQSTIDTIKEKPAKKIPITKKDIDKIK
jgi:hypothetical protein